MVLLRARVLSGGGARWSAVVAGLLLWRRRIGESAPCVDPPSVPAPRSPRWRWIRWRRCGGSAVWGSGALVVGLATSGEVGRCCPQIRRGWRSGPGPGRWRTTVKGSSSPELATDAARQRLRARISSAPGCRSPGCCVLRRLRWWSSGCLVFLVVVAGVPRQIWPLYPLPFPACIWICMFVFFV